MDGLDPTVPKSRFGDGHDRIRRRDPVGPKLLLDRHVDVRLRRARGPCERVDHLAHPVARLGVVEASHLGLDAGRRCAGQQVLHVDAAVEAEPIAELELEVLRLHLGAGGLDGIEHVHAQPDQLVDEGDTVIFDGSGSTDTASDGPTLLYTWYFPDGTVRFGISVTHVFTDDGNYTVTLVVQDDNGYTDSDDLVVQVGNVAPTADAGGPYPAVEGSTVSILGSASDPGDDSLLFEWDFDDSDGVTYTDEALEKAKAFEADPLANELGTCMVKTHLSLSHDPDIKGRPRDWELPISDVLVYKGAGFIVPVAGAIKLMPGTASNPAFRRIDVDVKTGKVQGLF